MHCYRLLCLALIILPIAARGQQKSPYYLIAHRGGVVDSARAENSLASLEAAYRQGYKMVELDMRLTRDGKLIIHHDNNFEKYFGDKRKVSEMTWQEITVLRGNHRVLKLEEALQYCSGKMQVMIDNKIPGNDTVVWNRLIRLLDRYHLLDSALMIGTGASTEFFTGKIRLSCSRKQLEANRKRADYIPDHYYLFGNDLTKEDIQWATQHGILPVGVVNNWIFTRNSTSKNDIEKQISDMKKSGLLYFQIDSEYLPYFLQ